MRTGLPVFGSFHRNWIGRPLGLAMVIVGARLGFGLFGLGRVMAASHEEARATVGA